MPPRIPLHPTLVRAAAPGAVSAVRPISSSSVRRAVPVNEDDPDGLNVDKDKEAADEFKTWLKGPGQNFKKPLYNEMNYVSSYDFKTWQRKGVDKDRMNNPFSLNPAFRSFPVLSDTLREAIYTRVVKKGRTVRSVSAELNVNMDRVAAVVRLKSIEKTWIEQEKPLATYLTKALHSMLPVTQLAPPGVFQAVHDNIQELQSHPLSHRQIFLPVSEGRVFSRVDAGKEFGLPPTEEAVSHPDLVKLSRELKEGLDQTERVARQRERDRLEQAQRAEEALKAAEKAANSGIVIEQGRYAWRLTDAKTGIVGHRYGVPHEDRKKGQVKIPTRVE